MSGPDIFLSYARADRAAAHLFADTFEQEGFTVWWDASLHSGEMFDEVIEKNLRDAKAVVVLWSPRSVTSRWVRAEANLADRRKKLAPAVIEPCDRPIIFELTHAAELSHWKGDVSDPHWRDFIDDLHRIAARDAKVTDQSKDRPAAKISAAPSAPEAQLERDGGILAAASAVVADEIIEAHFLELDSEELGAKSFPINGSGTKIGRSAPADIVVPDKSVSRDHCLVGIANDELLVTDLSSTNGTFVDGERITRTTILPVGSELRIGQIPLRHVVRPRGESGPNGAVARVTAAH